MSSQLILSDHTLRVLGLFLPEGPVFRAVAAARDPMDGGHISVEQARELATVLDGPCGLADCQAKQQARHELRIAFARIDLDVLEPDHRTVSVFLHDPDRDGPLPEGNGAPA